MPKHSESVQDADSEVHPRAEGLYDTISQEDQAHNDKLLQPVFKLIQSPSSPSRGLRTSNTPPLFPSLEAAYIAPAEEFDPSENQFNTLTMLSMSLEMLQEDYTDEVDEKTSSSSSKQKRSHSNCSTATSSRFSTETGRSVEQNENTDEIEENIGENGLFDRFVQDARNNLGGKKPNFVLSNVNVGSRRMVTMDNNETAEMTFVAWDKSKGQGYWVLKDNFGDNHIVKYFKQSNCYKEWGGTGAGFAREPLAWPLSGQGDSVPIIKKKVENNHSHDLRNRTWSQENPYSADKEIYASSKKGRVKRKAEIDAREASDKLRSEKSARWLRQESKTSEGFKATNESTKPRRSISTSTTISSDKRDLDLETLKATMLSRTTLKTILPSDNDVIPLRLSECPNLEELWAKVLRVWEGEYEGEVKSLSITFPWLSPGYNIKLKPGLTSSYDTMIEEVQDNPCWTDGTYKCTIDITLNVG